MNAFVLFNGSHDGAQEEGAYKALLPLEGRPIFLYILKALDQVRCIDQIVVIGPQKGIMNAIERSLPDALFEKKIVVLDKKAGLFENVQQVYNASSSPSRDSSALKMLPKTDPHALFLPAEIPLVTTQEIETFLSKSKVSENESIQGVTREEALGLFHPNGEKPGFRMEGVPVNGAAYRMIHLHLVPPHDSNGLKALQKIYAGRDPLTAISPELPKIQSYVVETGICGGVIKVLDDKSYQVMSLRFNEWRAVLMPKTEGNGETKVCPLSGHICREI